MMTIMDVFVTFFCHGVDASVSASVFARVLATILQEKSVNVYLMVLPAGSQDDTRWLSLNQ